MLARTLLATLVAIGTLGWSIPAQAVSLNKAFAAESFLDTSLSGTTSALRPELAGTVLVDEVQNFSMANGGITGSVQSRVLRETASGTLDFYWQVTVDPSSTAGGVASLRLSDFGYNDITDGDYRVDSTGTISPFIARVFNPADRPTGAINFLFTDPPIQAGAESKLFFLRTSATSYAKTAKYDLTANPDGLGISPSFSTFAPAVPEPTALTLVLGGLGYLLARGRRRS